MSEFYVIFPTSLLSYEDARFIGKKETDALLVFFILGKLSNFHNRTTSFCNVNLIDGMLNLDPNNVTRSRRRVVDALETLEQKGYITMTYEGGDLLTAPLIEVQRIEEQKSSVSGGSTFSGFIKVYEDVFQLADGDGKLFKVLLFTLWRQNIDYSISLNEWGKVLDVSESSVKRMLKEYEKQGKLIVSHGSYYRDDKGRLKQKMNKYRVPSRSLQREELETVTPDLEKPVTIEEVHSLLIVEELQEEPHEDEQEGIEINGQKLIF